MSVAEDCGIVQTSQVCVPGTVLMTLQRFFAAFESEAYLTSTDVGFIVTCSEYAQVRFTLEPETKMEVVLGAVSNHSNVFRCDVNQRIHSMKNSILETMN